MKPKNPPKNIPTTFLYTHTGNVATVLQELNLLYEMFDVSACYQLRVESTLFGDMTVYIYLTVSCFKGVGYIKLSKKSKVEVVKNFKPKFGVSV